MNPDNEQTTDCDGYILDSWRSRGTRWYRDGDGGWETDSDGRAVMPAVLVDPDGNDALVMLIDQVEGTVTTEVPAHERLGKLPEDIRRRLGWFCGIRTHQGRGRPCRKVVNAPGERCPHHRDVWQRIEEESTP